MECPKFLAPLARAAFLQACASDERPVLRIVSDATFAPFHFIGDGGTPTGFDIEFARLIAERVGLEPTVEVLPYGELFGGLSAKAHDVVAATTGWTAERAATYLFTEPYFVTCQAALVRVGPDEPATLADLSGRRVGASESGTAARAMRSIEGGTPVTLEEGAGLELLLTGAVDAIIVDEFDAVEASRESDGQLRVLAQPVARERYAFVLARDRHALKAQLDQALATLEAEGEVAALRARFGVERDAEWPVQIVQIGSGMVVTEGVAQKSGPCSVTIECPVDGNVREALCGEITAAGGSVWEVPGLITDGATLVDVYNECSVGGDNPDFESELSTIVVDEDGSEVTAYLFGDNYFELYANGRFIGRDAVGFTPFNAHAARYRVSYPITYAALLVDWEGYLGVGLEDTRNRFHIGDGGFIASFSDGAKTGRDGSVKCSTSHPSTMRAASRWTPPETLTLPAVRAATTPWPASVRTRRAPVAARISSSRAIG